MTVQIGPPHPSVETGRSYVLTAIQVETAPSFAGDLGDVSSPQLQSVSGVTFVSIISGVKGQATIHDQGNAHWSCSKAPQVRRGPRW
jgi:hypothetical protein